MNMKKPLFLLLCTIALTSHAQTCIIPGDYPDPSILRDGKDFYMTHSPFYYKPGFLIWHSTDLCHWKPVCRAIDNWEGSAMAPDLVKCNGKYYIYYPAKGTNWVVWADRMEGPWSKPIDLHLRLIDPGHLQTPDGKRYLYTSDGYVVRLADDGLSAIGKQEKTYDGWVYPSEWDTECMCLESPKLTFKDGFYYMTTAEGGTAGPATSHMVVSARSKSPLGPWENSPLNPIVHTYSAAEPWWSKGHGTLVDDADGNWWIVYHAYAKDYHTLGRQTLIEPIEWTADGWFKTKGAPVPMHFAATMPLSDNFTAEKLGIQWTFWKECAPEALSIGNGKLTMEAKGTSPSDARVLLATATDTSYVAQVDVTVDEGAEAGLMLFYNEKAYAGLISDGNTFKVYTNATKCSTVKNEFSKSFQVRLENKGNVMTVKVSNDGKRWKTIAEGIDVSSLHHNNYKGFYALRIALTAYGNGKATFRKFTYK